MVTAHFQPYCSYTHPLQHIMKKNYLYLLVIFILCSCSSKRFIGTYSHLEKIDNRVTIERLKLNDKSTFEYSKHSYIESKNSRSGSIRTPIIIGKGEYQIKNDSIYLNFQKDNFNYAEYSKEYLSIIKYPLKNQQSRIKIDFGTGNYGIRIINQNDEISMSNIEGIAEFEILEDKFPIDLRVDFSKSDFHIFKNYDLRLLENANYDIYFGLPYPNKFKKDLVFPIIKTKSEIQIGEMKNVL